MASLNILKTNVLINTDEVIFHAPVQAGLDVRTFINNIIIAERRFVKPILGSGLYKTLIDTKNVVVTEGNIAAMQILIDTNRPTDRAAIAVKQGDIVNSDTFLNADQLKLWSDYLHKITAECVYWVSLPVNRARFTSEGVELNNPESIASSQKAAAISLADLKYLLDRGLQDRISFLIQDMHEYLCTTSFAGYQRDCGCDSKGKPYRKKTSIMFSMYDDIDHRDCGCNGPDRRRDENFGR